MEIKAFVQMGVERRETVIEIPDEEVEAGRRYCASNEQSMEGWLEHYVHEWAETQTGWGWSGGGFDIDFGHLEGADSVGSVAVSKSGVPNTKRIRVGPGEALSPDQRQPIRRPTSEALFKVAEAYRAFGDYLHATGMQALLGSSHPTTIAALKVIDALVESHRDGKGEGVPPPSPKSISTKVYEALGGTTSPPPESTSNGKDEHN